LESEKPNQFNAYTHNRHIQRNEFTHMRHAHTEYTHEKNV